MSDIFFSDAGVYEDDPPSIRDVRREQMLAPAAASPMEHQTARMDAILDGICRRLLEQATAGRLTWDGDAIVQTSPGRPGRPACPVPPTGNDEARANQAAPDDGVAPGVALIQGTDANYRNRPTEADQIQAAVRLEGCHTTP